MKIDHPLPGDIAALRQLWKEAFGDTDAFLDTFFATVFRCDHCLCIREQETILAAAYWMDCQIDRREAAYIYAVATAESRRGRGLCRTLMDEIHAILRQRGYCGTVLVPGDPDLRQMYGAMGYRNFGGIREFSCNAGETAVPMQKITPEAFAILRRQYLPEHAVIQEGAQLALLGTLAAFYRGKDFILTLSRDGGRVLELLGNETNAPAITNALGISSALFRKAGTQPFAMYLPLDDGIFPTYFAFAFD